MRVRLEQPRVQQPSPIRLIALVTVGLCLSSNLGALLHFGLVSHDLCLEHGVVIHTTEESPQSSVAQILDSEEQSDPDQTLSGFPISVSGHEHDSCHVLGASRDRVGVAVEQTASSTGTAGPIAVVPETCDVYRTEALYLLAPKTSPPPSVFA